MIVLDVLQEQVRVWSADAFGPGVKFDRHLHRINEAVISLYEHGDAFTAGKAGEVDRDVAGSAISDAVLILVSLAGRCGVDLEAALAVRFAQARQATERAKHRA